MTANPYVVGCLPVNGANYHRELHSELVDGEELLPPITDQVLQMCKHTYLTLDMVNDAIR